MRKRREIEVVREIVQEEAGQRGSDWATVHRAGGGHADIRLAGANTLTRGVQVVGAVKVGDRARVVWRNGRPEVVGTGAGASGAVQAAGVASSGAGVVDHGALTGLGDDDHAQYFNQARGDARYALAGHTHGFLGLTETPDSYVGQGGKVVRVKSDASGLEFAAAGAGTVTSVALSAPNIFTVSGSPVTGAGTLALALATQGANLVFAGPASGGAATPGFRALVAADLPGHSHAASDVSSGVFGIARLPVAASGVSSATEVVRADDARLSNSRTPNAHASSHASGGSDPLTGNLDAIARTTVRKNTGGANVGARRRLNFIEGANVALTIADDSANEEIDITIAATGLAASSHQHPFGDITGTVTDGQHGDRGGGTLHATVTTSAAGFMSAADKTKLDGIAAGAVSSHAALSGLSADDHPQYYDQTRGDARYARLGAANTFLAGQTVESTGVSLILQRTTTTSGSIVVSSLFFRRRHSGAPSNGFGVRQQFQLSNTTTEDANVGGLDFLWTNATGGSHTGRTRLVVNDWNAEREAFRAEADGSEIRMGFFGATAVVQRSPYTQNYVTASRTVNAMAANTLTNTNGTGDTTIADVGTTFNQTVLNNNFRDLSNQINNLVADVLAMKQVQNALIDDQQALGFAG